MSIDIDFCKRVQVVNFFAKNAPGKTIDKIELLKAVFFADRYHLLQNGRTVTEDTYYAMKHGPVASEVKNICTLERMSDEQMRYIRQFLRINKDSVHSRKEREYDASLFSDSDIIALNEALALYRDLKKNRINIAEYSHRFFDWDNKYAPFLPIDENNRIDMDIDEFFNILAEDDYCAKIDPERRDLNRELINY